MSKQKHYYQLSDVTNELFKLREKGLTRGKEIGFDFDKCGMSVKKGCTTYIAGAPASGKSEFWLEVLVNLSCIYGDNHIIFTPETGEVHEVFAELCHKYVNKPYFGKDGVKMTETDKAQSEYFIGEHFIVIDPKDDTMSLDEYYEMVDKVEKELDWKFATTTIDPFNEVKHDFSGRQDLYIEELLGKCRRNARKTGRHNCLIAHVRDQPIIEKDGKRFCPMPTPREFAGGQAWFRKGEQMIIVWRPPYGVTRDNGQGTYEANEAIIRIAKEKPKGASKKGDYTFFYNKEMNAYYCKDWDGVDIYADRTPIKSRAGKQETLQGLDAKEEDNFFKNKSFERTTDEDDILQNTPF